jgi:hypothetical protein
MRRTERAMDRTSRGQNLVAPRLAYLHLDSVYVRQSRHRVCGTMCKDFDAGQRRYDVQHDELGTLELPDHSPCSD